MNRHTLEELIKFCESKNLKDMASGLKKDLKAITAAQDNKENAQERALMIIRKSIKANDAVRMHEELKLQGVDPHALRPLS